MVTFLLPNCLLYAVCVLSFYSSLLTVYATKDLSAVETKLLDDLFKNYSSSVMPPLPVEAKFKLYFKQIVSLDEKNEILTTSSNLFAAWYDPRLRWEPAQHSNISFTLIQAKKLWLVSNF